MRADARRSRRRLLEAGAAAFAEFGLDVPVSEITQRAGLAKGTFFRHFPTKRDLLVAIVAERIRRDADTARALLADPGHDVLARFMIDISATVAPIRAVVEMSILHGVEDPAIQAAMAELIPLIDQLLAQARRQGSVRDDVTAIDIYILHLAATMTSSHQFFFRDTPELWRRYLAIVLDGLRPAAANPISVPGPLLGNAGLPGPIRIHPHLDGVD
jgi:AcrR family transcriptional regulator